MTASVGPAVGRGDGDQAATDKGLKAGALGLLSSVVIGVASTAPAYSLAATLGFVVLAVGLHAPAIMLIAFVPMLFIAIAYQELNKADPDCGTTFTWAARAFGPRSGWMGGWGIVAADVIVMANLAQIAGSYFFLLFNADGLAASTAWVTLVGVLWIVAMTWICYVGIEVSARLQQALLAIEVVMLSLFSIVALVKVYTGNAPAGSVRPSASWFNPFAVGSFSAFTAGLLLAIFIYWGWDTAVSINEETADRDRTPGRAAILSTLLLLGTYAIVTTASQAFAGVGTSGLGLGNSDNSGDVLSVLGTAVFGSGRLGTVLAHLLVLMVLTSAAASTQTTILPTARTTLSMAAYRAIPRTFARIHRRHLTPSVSTITMGLASIAFYVLLTIVSGNVLADSIASLGVLIAFYYGLTGFACAWHYRHELTHSARSLFLRGVIPLLGALLLFAALVKSLKDMWSADYGATFWTTPTLHWQIGGVFLLALGSLLLGVVLMVIYAGLRPAYFRGELLNRSTPVVAVPERGTVETGSLSLPDAPTREHLVVPPDEDGEVERWAEADRERHGNAGDTERRERED
jgi:amino acid transporter